MLWHWGRRGGGPRYTMELARALAGRSGLDLHLSLSRQSDLFAGTDAVGVPSHHVDTYRNVATFALRSPLLPLIRRKFVAYLKQERIDVVYNTMDFLWGAAIAPAIPRSDVLYLLAVHDAERHPGEDGPVRRWLLARDIASADGVITLTDAVRERLLAVHRFPPQRAWTAPLGVFLDTPVGKSRQLPVGRPIRLLFFGRVLPYKGLDMMLEAMPFVRAALPDAELEIWGSGDLAPYRDALASTNGVRLHHGWLDEDAIPGIFARTDLCVLPYREASQSAVVATALASGMPIVTTPIAGLVEQIEGGRAGRIASDLSPQAFASAVVALARDPAAYARMSGEAIAISSSSLSWGSIGDRVEAAARSLDKLGPRNAK